MRDPDGDSRDLEGPGQRDEPHDDQREQTGRGPSWRARWNSIAGLRRLYDEHPTEFALGAICVSALSMVFGGVLTGDLDLSVLW